MILSAEHISFSYAPTRFSLRDVSVHAHAGRMTGIIGANGSGKTTLLKLLAGLLEHQSGTIMLDGVSVDDMTFANRARRIAFLPQSHRPAFEFTVEQTVLLGRIPHRGSSGAFESEEDVAAADTAVRTMELESLRHVSITQLSGGELQRVMIARSLAQHTDVLLLDEPQSHLDIAHQYNVLRALKDHATSNNRILIASIHDLNLASMLCDDIAVMAEGTLLCTGTPSETLTVPILHRAFGIELDVVPNTYGEAPAIRYK